MLSPLRVGALTLANRVVFGAHLTNFARDGLPTDRHRDYYAARAAGGAGLIVTEEHVVHPSDHAYERLIQGWRDDTAASYRSLTDAVHAHGTPILAQLNHNGAQGTSAYSRRPLLAPTALPDPMFREVPREATADDLAELVAAYAGTAARCVRGGFDGVEIQCSQSSILRAFLAPALNRRTDGYGGTVAQRARLVLEVVRAVRSAIGDAVLGVRLATGDGTAGGVSIADATVVAGLLDPHVDYLGTSPGSATETLHLVEGSMAMPHGYALSATAQIRAAVTVPVIGAGRLDDPDVAERALADGECDLVAVVRGQIADPHFVEKIASGRADTVTSCLACNQDCIGRVGLGRSVACCVNPSAGREGHTRDSAPGPRRTVLVVGGGPAGLKAAATAARRGHHVTVLERDRLGGRIRTAAAAPTRGRLGRVVDELVDECVRAGVDLRTGVHADAATVAEWAADDVIVATGARAHRPAWAEPGSVTDAGDIDGALSVGAGRVGDGEARQPHAIVFDELGFHEATSAAEMLAEAGFRVTVCTSGAVVGQDLGLTLDLAGWRARTARFAVDEVTEVSPQRCVRAGTHTTLSLVHYPSGRDVHLMADVVVAAVAPRADDGLWRQLRARGIAAVRIGDALAPRRLDAAVREGAAAGSAIGARTHAVGVAR
nr:FAD-dependent oxidoreductase [Rhodococcus sp. HNM0569]